MGIPESWARCRDKHRLDPSRKLEVPGLSRAELKDHQGAFDENMSLVSEVLWRLQKVVDGSGYSASIADSHGVIIAEKAVANPDCYCESDRVGAVWTEHGSGTNGIGTCLVEQTATAVYHGEHFLSALSDQACAAVPFFGADEHLLGVINVSTCNPKIDEATHQLAMNVAIDAGEGLDARLFHDAFRHAFIIRLRSGHLEDMLLAVDEDACILGASRRARRALNIRGSALGSRGLWGVFERTARLRTVRDLCEGSVQLRTLAGLSMVVSTKAPRHVARQAAPVLNPVPPKRPAFDARTPLDRCAGSDAKTARQVVMVRRMLGAALPFLILGETGVGKDMFARAIHEESSRAKEPFVAFNCAAVPETLIDSELFGYGSGAFTGAKREGSQGRLVEANGGTLFLDEIGDMPLAQQTRLLRALESGEVMPLGGGKTRKVDLQIVAATHQDIEGKVAAGLFRQDLYYRLAGTVVALPALRERDDVAEIFAALVRGFPEGSALRISAEAVEAVRRHVWPGNIREMKHVAQRAVRLCDDGVIRVDDLMLTPSLLAPRRPEPTLGSFEREPAGPPPSHHGSAKDAAALAERSFITNAMSEPSQTIEACAKKLGMSRATLYRKLKAYGLTSLTKEQRI